MPFDSNDLFNNAVAVTATGNSSSLDVGAEINPLTYEIVVTAVSGTSPTLDIKIQGSDDNSTWKDLVVVPQITAKTTSRRKIKTSYRYLREARTVGGTTPSFTYTSGLVLGGRDKNIG